MASSLTDDNSSVGSELLLQPVTEYFFGDSSCRTLIRNADIPRCEELTYQPLSPGQIRVLYVLPGTYDCPLECILAPAGFRDGGAYFAQLIQTKEKTQAFLIHNRDQNGKNVYNALSYVWGDPTTTKTIFVNCYAFPVTRNLYDALKAIRDESSSYTVWVDAICINQKDNVEKSQQIALMKRIYLSATLIVAFLGASTKHTDDAFEAIKRVAGNFPLDMKRFQDPPEEFVATSGFNPRTDLGDSAILGLKDICQRPYWSRVWIQQEFGTNTNTAVRCGNKIIRKHQLTSVCMLLLHYEMGTSNLIKEGINVSAVMNYTHVEVHSNSVGFKDQGVTYFMEALHASRGLFASDIKDKVFAMFPSLAENYLKAYGKPLVGFAVDYRLPATQVYGSVAWWCISTDKTLDALGYVDHENSSQPNIRLSLPSWVPQWSCASVRRPFLKWLFPDNGTPRRAYSASGDFQSDSGLHIDFTFDDTRNEVGLTCVGFRLDRIAKVAEPQCESNGLDVSIEKSWAPENPDSLYEYTGETMRAAYRRTIHADMKSYEFTPYLAVERGFPSDYDPFETDQILSKDRGLLKVASRYRRLAYTEGGIIALVPSIAQEGDEIFILKNGSVCYVLRETRTPARADEVVIGEDPNNGVRIVLRDREEGPLIRFSDIAYSFVFLGEAYAHGFMDGEALRLLDRPVEGLLDQCWEEIKIV
jgi:hypothetical protein